MTGQKESAPWSAGRKAREGEMPKDAIQSAVQILTSAHPLRHIRTDWATRTELAKAFEVHPDTVTRRCRRAGVAERIVLNPKHRAQAEFLVGDVLGKLLGRSV